MVVVDPPPMTKVLIETVPEVWLLSDVWVLIVVVVPFPTVLVTSLTVVTVVLMMSVVEPGINTPMPGVVVDIVLLTNTSVTFLEMIRDGSTVIVVVLVMTVPFWITVMFEVEGVTKV